MLEESSFDFMHVRLYDLDIPTEKWLNYLQTVDPVMIWVCTVFQLPV